MKVWPIIAILLLASPAAALDIKITVKDDSETRLIELCEATRGTLPVPPLSWTLEQCATYLFAKTLRGLEAVIAQKSVMAVVEQTMNDVKATAEVAFPDDGKAER